MVQALIVLLGLSALLDVALGAWAGVAWRSFAGFWFPQNPSMAGDDPHLLGVVLTFFLLFVAVLQGIALAWVRKEKPQGFAIATAFGGYLVVSSLVTFVIFRRFEFLLVDGLRGALLVVTSMIGMNEPSTVRSLRLPARSERDERAPRDARPERGRHRRHERDGRRDSRPGRGGREDRGGRGRRSGGSDSRGSDSRGSDSRGSESRGGESRGDRSRPAPATAEAGRARPAEAEDESKRSLAVVVKGEFKTRPGGAEGDDGGDSDDRKRRRRRRRRGGVGEGAESGGTSAPDSALPEDAVVSASGEEPRRRRGGQRRRGGRGRGESRGADDAANRSVDSSGASSGGGDLVGDAPRPPAPVRAAEVIRPSSEPSAAESSSRGANELFGLTREAIPYEPAAEAPSGEDLYGRTRRADRPRRPSLSAREGQSPSDSAGSSD